MFCRERLYSPTAHMVSGALAGGIAAAITTPLDVCKTLLNTQQSVKLNGMVQAVKTVYRLRGISGYFRGNNYCKDIRIIFCISFNLIRYAS